MPGEFEDLLPECERQDTEEEDRDATNLENPGPDLDAPPVGDDDPATSTRPDGTRPRSRSPFRPATRIRTKTPRSQLKRRVEDDCAEIRESLKELTDEGAMQKLVENPTDR